MTERRDDRLDEGTTMNEAMEVEDFNQNRTKQGASMTKVEEIILKYHWKFELFYIIKGLEPQVQVFAS